MQLGPTPTMIAAGVQLRRIDYKMDGVAGSHAALTPDLASQVERHAMKAIELLSNIDSVTTSIAEAVAEDVLQYVRHGASLLQGGDSKQAHAWFMRAGANAEELAGQLGGQFDGG